MKIGERNVYLKMKTLEEAREILFENFSFPGAADAEMVSVPDAVGRVLAGPVEARLSSPNYNAAAMDGIAVRSGDTFGANEFRPKTLTVGKEAFYINTGHVMPGGADAVIMIEHVHALDDDR
ncbi:MAG: molybdopterin biosynthesis protein, partial [Desulfobacterales bacterium]|nr:molybdopterin biosynthesis protein [Desulfobacterales bacterium]